MRGNLQGALEKMFHWLSTNNVVAIAGKCHLLISPKTPVNIYISNNELLNEGKVKCLEFARKCTFKESK